MRFIAMILFALFGAISVAFGVDSNIYHTKMGESDIYIISLEKMSPPVEKLIANNSDDKAFIAKLAPQLAQNNQNIMLIRHKNFVALVDTGFSHNFDTLKSRLSQLKLTPSDITHIIITHAHGDHIGGILQNGANQFSSAVLMIDKGEYDFWVNGKDFSGFAIRTAKSAKDALLSFKNKVIFFNHDKTLNESLGIKSAKDLQIRSIKAYGHTPGHTMIEIASGGKRIVFVADLFHTFDIQKARPQIAIQYDINPSEAVKSRVNFLETLEGESGVYIIGSHLPFIEPILWK